MKPLACDREDARRFMRSATALDPPLPDVGSALARLGFAQLDPINVCGRMHDLLLRNRVAGYCEGDLQRHLHPERGERLALEHFLPGQGILASFPVEDWRFLAPHARERARSDSGFSGRLDARERRHARRVLAEIDARGALMPEEIAHQEVARSGLKRTLWQAESIAYSASVSGAYLTTELYQRLGIADRVMSKSRLISGGERVDAAVARGEAEIGFLQISELLPVAGIDHVTPLPPEVQQVSIFSAGIAISSRDAEAARAIIKFLLSREAAHAIAKSGLEPIGNL